MERHSTIRIWQCGSQMGCASRSPGRGSASKRDAEGPPADDVAVSATSARVTHANRRAARDASDSRMPGRRLMGGVVWPAAESSIERKSQS